MKRVTFDKTVTIRYYNLSDEELLMKKNHCEIIYSKLKNEKQSWLKYFLCCF